MKDWTPGDRGPTVAILIATYQRGKMLREVLAKLDYLTRYRGFFVTIVWDGDREGFDGFSQEDRERYDFPIRTHLMGTNSEYVRAMNTAYKLSLDADLFAHWSDDTFPTEAWLTAAVERFLESFPDGKGIVSFNHFWGEQLITHGIFDRKFVELLDYPGKNFLYPEYIHFGADNDLTMLAKRNKAVVYAADIKVIHPTPKETSEYACAFHRKHDGEVWKRREAGG